MSGKNRREMRCGAEVRASPGAEQSAPRFEGYAAVFDSWSDDLGGFREKIAPGAFADTVRADDVRLLLNHKPEYVVGRTKAGTLELREDDRGLWFSAPVPDCQWARDLYESVKRGDIDQCSFCFDLISDAWTEVPGQLAERTLTKVRLSDVSIVTYPAYPATSVAARSADQVLAEHQANKPSACRISILRARIAMKEKELT